MICILNILIIINNKIIKTINHKSSFEFILKVKVNKSIYIIIYLCSMYTIKVLL